MYNEKKEAEKVNFGELPVDWEDTEFAEEIYEDQTEQYKQKTQQLSRKLEGSYEQLEE